MRKNLLWRDLGALVLPLLLGALACNAPLAGNETAAPPTTNLPTGGTPGAPQTLAPLPGTPSPGPTDGMPRPTFTRIAPPTLAVTPQATSTLPPAIATAQTSGTATATPTPTTTAGAGPLSFSFEITWRLNPNNAQQSIATVRITASGGGGGYLYFRDDLPVAGPEFEYTWVSCQPNPGSLRVDSADGQSMRVDYFQIPPCPTATATAQP